MKKKKKGKERNITRLHTRSEKFHRSRVSGCRCRWSARRARPCARARRRALPHIYPYNLFPSIKIQSRRITMTKLSGQESLTPSVGDYDRRPRRESDMHIQRCKVHLVRVNLARLLFILGQSALARRAALAFPLESSRLFLIFSRIRTLARELSPVNIRRAPLPQRIRRISCALSIRPVIDGRPRSG